MRQHRMHRTVRILRAKHLKTSADMIVMAYRDTYKMPVTITRCSNNYGPYHFPGKTDSAYHQQCAAWKETSGIWRRKKCPRLAVCG